MQVKLARNAFKNETFCGTLIHCVFPVAWKKLLENDDDVRNKTVKVQKSIDLLLLLPYIFYNYLKRTKSAKSSLETDPNLLCR